MFAFMPGLFGPSKPKERPPVFFRGETAFRIYGNEAELVELLQKTPGDRWLVRYQSTGKIFEVPNGVLRKKEGPTAKIIPIKPHSTSIFEDPPKVSPECREHLLEYGCSPTYNFSHALLKFKHGQTLKRLGWSSPDMEVSLRTEAGIRPYFVMKTKEGDLAVWFPAICDILAEDWVVVK